MTTERRKGDRRVPPALAEFAVSQLAEAGEQTAIDLAVQNVEILRAEVAKRDARISELEGALSWHEEQTSTGVVLPPRAQTLTGNALDTQAAEAEPETAEVVA